MEGGLIVGGIRGAIAAVRWWFRLPATKARHRTKMKAEIEDKLPRYADDRDYRGEAIIRDLRRMDDYPELDDDIAGRFATRCERQRRFELVFALNHQDVGKVDRARFQPNLNFTGPGRAEFDLLEDDAADIVRDRVAANAADPLHC